MTPGELAALDAAIVRAAEEWANHDDPEWPINVRRLLNAVDAKREARRPKCFCKCGSRATHKIVLATTEYLFSCTEHLPEVVEL